MQMFHRFGVTRRLTGDLNRSELTMLKLVRALGQGELPVTISHLSEHLSISKPAVSQVINSLELKGLVTRAGTRDDRRMVQVRITDHGEAMLKKEMAALRASLVEIFDRMGDQDTDELLRLMEKLFVIAQEVQAKTSDSIEKQQALTNQAQDGQAERT